MGAEKAVLSAGSKPTDWVKDLQEAFAPGRKHAELSSPDFRFVDYPYQQPSSAEDVQAQNALRASVQKKS